MLIVTATFHLSLVLQYCLAGAMLLSIFHAFEHGCLSYQVEVFGEYENDTVVMCYTALTISRIACRDDDNMAATE